MIKVKAVYEAVIFFTDYDLNARITRISAPYSWEERLSARDMPKATQYLLNHLGLCAPWCREPWIPERRMPGIWSGGRGLLLCRYHMGDASYRMEDGSEQEGLSEINYDYLCVTTEDILRTHRIEAVIPMPECTATEANYSVRAIILLPITGNRCRGSLTEPEKWAERILR